MVHFSDWELAVLRNSPLYKKYESMAFSALTCANIETDLDAIANLSIETLPILKYLTHLYSTVSRRAMYEDYDEWLNTYYKNVDYRKHIIEIGTPSIDVHTHDKIYYIEMVATALSSGAAANTTLIAATASKKVSIAWSALSWDTAPATAYTCDYHENAGSTIVDNYIVPANAGEKRYIFADTSTVNKALENSYAGGAGTENLFETFSYCKF